MQASVTYEVNEERTRQSQRISHANISGRSPQNKEKSKFEAWGEPMLDVIAWEKQVGATGVEYLPERRVWGISHDQEGPRSCHWKILTMESVVWGLKSKPNIMCRLNIWEKVGERLRWLIHEVTQAQFLLSPGKWVSLPCQPTDLSNQPMASSCGNQKVPQPWYYKAHLPQHLMAHCWSSSVQCWALCTWPSAMVMTMGRASLPHQPSKRR